MTQISVAIDGSASSGKSTAAKILAKELNYIYTDTGAMYRAVTYLAITSNISFPDEEGLVSLIKKYPISSSQQEDGQHIFITSKDVTLEIRQPDITKAVSEVSVHGKVREGLVAVQRKIGERSGVAIDGRDIGTAVLPNAEVKISLVANVSERTEGRFKENQERGIPTDFETLTKEVQEGDHYDSTRDVSPLKQAEDAVRIDTTGKSISGVAATIKAVVLKKGCPLF